MTVINPESDSHQVRARMCCMFIDYKGIFLTYELTLLEIGCKLF